MENESNSAKKPKENEQTMNDINQLTKEKQELEDILIKLKELIDKAGHKR